MSSEERQRRLKFWGWGWDDEGPDEAACGKLAVGMGARFGRELSAEPFPRIDQLELRPPRVVRFMCFPADLAKRLWPASLPCMKHLPVCT